MKQHEEPNGIERALLLISAAVVLYGFAALLDSRNTPQAPVISSGHGLPSSSLQGLPAAFLFSSPIYCDARIRQSGAEEHPRTRLLHAIELNDARCYVRKS